MQVDAVSKVMMVLFLGALAVFLVRLIMLRIQNRFPLFVISNGLDMVFGVTMVALGTETRSLLNVDLLGLVMGATLTPFVAFELYRSQYDEDHQSLRFLVPITATVVAGCIVTAYLGSTPDEESMKGAYEFGILFDTVVTFGVLGLLVGKMRHGVSPADRNLSWMRRLFVFEVASSGLLTLVDALAPAQSGNVVHLIYVGLSFVVMAVCALALRKQQQVTPAESP
jgi:hypothetical protein